MRLKSSHRKKTLDLIINICKSDSLDSVNMQAEQGASKKKEKKPWTDIKEIFYKIISMVAMSVSNQGQPNQIDKIYNR